MSLNIQHTDDRDNNNAECSKSAEERRERESIYKRNKHACTHEGCDLDSFAEGVCKSITVKNKTEKAS